MKQVYFAQCGDRIKIGVANNVTARLAQLRTGAGGPLALIAAVDGGREVEKALHKKLARHHIDGEWFRDCEEVRKAIQNSLSNFGASKSVNGKPRGNAKFSAVARLLWPHKTAETLAMIAGADARSGHRWLSGEHEPPAIVVAAILHEITRRDA